MRTVYRDLGWGLLKIDQGSEKRGALNMQALTGSRYHLPHTLGDTFCERSDLS